MKRHEQVRNRKHAGTIEKFIKSKVHQKGDFALSRDLEICPRVPQKGVGFSKVRAILTRRGA